MKLTQCTTHRLNSFPTVHCRLPSCTPSLRVLLVLFAIRFSPLTHCRIIIYIYSPGSWCTGRSLHPPYHDAAYYFKKLEGLNNIRQSICPDRGPSRWENTRTDMAMGASWNESRASLNMIQIITEIRELLEVRSVCCAQPPIIPNMGLRVLLNMVASLFYNQIFSFSVSVRPLPVLTVAHPEFWSLRCCMQDFRILVTTEPPSSSRTEKQKHLLLEARKNGHRQCKNGF
jgi:hypothetical protein